MWRLVYVAALTISFVVVSGANAYAQALAPSTLGSESHDRKAADDMVQVITEKSAGKTASKPVHPITKKRAPVAMKKPAQNVVKEPATTIANDSTQTVTEKPVQAMPKSNGRTFALEPVRPMNQPTVSSTTKPDNRLRFRSLDDKMESAPVKPHYYH